MNISFFTHIKNTKPGSTFSIDAFLQNIKEGTWQDQIIALRAEKDPAKQKQLKQGLPLTTVSGTYKQRGAAHLLEHSGFIGMDLDEIEDPERLKKLLRLDPFVYSFFHSCRGHGLCVIFRIEPSKHREAFLGLQEYFYNKYDVNVDPSGKDVSRARFVSYDPDLHMNPSAAVFKQYPKGSRKKPVKIRENVHSDSDIDYVLSQINHRGLDITGSYGQWLELGFSFVSKYGENGRDYFHQVSQHSHLYDQKKTDKQFDHCLRHGSQSITISTFFHYAKENGCDIVSEDTKKAATFLSQQKRTKADKAGAVQTLVQHSKVPQEVAEQVAQQIYEEGKKAENPKDEELTEIEQAELYLAQYQFRYNEVTLKLEYPDGLPLEDRQMNNLWREVNKAIGKRVNFETVKRVLLSDFSTPYHPIREWFEAQPKTGDQGLIKKLVQCIPTDTGFQNGAFHPHLVEKFVRKWLIGVVQSVFGEHSPLMLVLMGPGNTGKTQFFRRLFPEFLQQYIFQTDLEQGNDSKIALTQKLLALIDEFHGSITSNPKKMKSILSQDVFTIRPPYGGTNLDLKRLAVFCGTSNDTEILNDPTGNRRIICVNVTDYMDFEKYNSIDKIALLMEAYHLWEQGERTDLSREEVEELKIINSGYEEVCQEEEFLKVYFTAPEDAPGALTEHLSTSEVKAYIEQRTNQRLSLKLLGQHLKSHFGERTNKKIRGKVHTGYTLVKIQENTH